MRRVDKLLQEVQALTSDGLQLSLVLIVPIGDMWEAQFTLWDGLEKGKSKTFRKKYSSPEEAKADIPEIQKQHPPKRGRAPLELAVISLEPRAPAIIIDDIPE